MLVDPAIQLLSKTRLSEADRVTVLTWLRAHPPAAAAAPTPAPAPTLAMLRTGGLFRLPPGFKIPTSVTLTNLTAIFSFTLTFDEPALMDGSVVDSFYTNYGATLSVIPGTYTPPSPHVYARAQQYPTAFSAPNSVSVIPAPLIDNSFDERSGIVHVQFATPQKSVSIMAYPEIQLDNCLGAVTVSPYLRFKDANGNVLQTVSYPITNGGFNYAWTSLGWMSSSANIASVEFSSAVPSSGCHVYGFFDQLSASPF